MVYEPDAEVTEAEIRQINTYADLHRKYLADRHPELYEKLRKSGELELHCRQRGEQALEMFETVSFQLDQTTRKKYFATDTLRLIQELEQIPHVAGEVVLKDLIWAL